MSKRRGVSIEDGSPTRQNKESMVSGSEEEDGGLQGQEATPVVASSMVNSISPVQLRSSARVLKKREEERKESESEGAESGPGAECTQAMAIATASATGGDGRRAERPRRAWEQWSAEDKDVFFEALNESGKNFGQMESYFQAKCSRRKSQLYKTREQIRTFYYRTWHKISKHIDFPEQLKKSVREIYGLVNYGEMRKKVGGGGLAFFLDEKMGQRLQELVFSGHTTVRFRGRTSRIRTPICRALKRINSKLDPIVNGGVRTSHKSPSSGSSSGGNSSGWGKNASGTATDGAAAAPTSLPDKLVVDLRPAAEADFYRVHAVCFQNPHVQMRLSPSTRLSCIIEHLEKKWTPVADRLRDSTRKFIVQSDFQGGAVDTADVGDKNMAEELWLHLTPGTKIIQPLLTPVAPLTSATLSLSHLQKKLARAKSSPLSPLPVDEDEQHQQLEHQNVKSEPQPVKTGPLVTPSVNDKPESCAQELQVDCTTLEWNMAKTKALSVGGLYLMTGCEGDKLELCYSWRRPHSSEDDKDMGKPPARNNCNLSSLIRLAVSEFAKKQLKPSGMSSPNVSRSNNINVPTSPGSVSNLSGGMVGVCNHKDAVPVVSKLENVSSETTASTSSSEIVVVGSGGNNKPPSAEFRRPVVPPVRVATLGSQSTKAQAFRQQLREMLPKFSNRKGRPLSSRKSSAVVSRRLLARPVQPKNFMERNGVQLRLLESGHPPNQKQMNSAISLVTLQAAASNLTMPVVPQQQQQTVTLVIPQSSSSGNSSNNSGSESSMSASSKRLDGEGEISPISSASAVPQISIPDSTTATTNDNISDLFVDDTDHRLPVSPVSKGDHFLDSVLENSNSSLLQTPLRHRPTPPSSPSRAVSESWLPELSLSSFLNLTDSPAKVQHQSGSNQPIHHQAQPQHSQPVQVLNINEDSSTSTNSEVDRQLLSMMTENSVDFTMKFAKLASHLNEAD